MKIFRIRKSNLQSLAIPAIGVLLLLPLLYFYHVISDFSVIEERKLEAMAREKLLIEAQAFQGDLNPRIFVQNSMRKMNLAFALTLPRSNFNTFKYPNGFDPELIGKDFIASASNYLLNNFGLVPAVFIAGSCDLKESYSYFGPGLIEDKQAQKNFVESGLLMVAVHDSKTINLLPGSLSLEERMQKIIQKGILDNTHLVFSDLFHKYVSHFSNPPYCNDNCEKFFSNCFDNQRAYNYHYKVKKDLPNEFEGIYGVYYVIFTGSSIQPEALIKGALKSSDEGVKRLIANGKLVRPYFQRTSKGLYYVSNLTSEFYQALNDASRNDPEKGKKYENFFKNHSICTFIGSSELASANRKILPILSFLSKLIFLMIFAFSVFSFLGMETFKMKLNLKLKMAVSIIVFIPIAGIFFTNRFINNASEEHEIIKFQTEMKKQIRLIEQHNFENDLRTAFRFLQRKEIDANAFISGKPDLDSLYFAHKKNENNELGVRSFFFDRNGRSNFLARDLPQTLKRSQTESVGLFKILNGLGYLNHRAQDIKQMAKKQNFLGSYGDSFWRLFASSPTLAKENEIVHGLFTVSALKRGLLQLIALKESPTEPYGAYYHDISDNRSGKVFLDNIPYFSTLKPSKALENGIIEYAIFMRATANLRKFHWPFGERDLGRLKLLAEKAMYQRSSGSSTTKKDGTIIHSSWSFREDSQLIIVGQARLKSKASQNFLLGLVPWVLFVYALIATIIISNGLANYFLQPVLLLISAVGLINKNKFDFKLQAEGNDEFSELSQSFNRMTQGLLQREKMKRFVSDKLVESIKAEQASTSEETRILDIAILSSDIRSFTTISEIYSPEEVVSLLNDYLTEMEKSIKLFGGSIEKIVGDAIIASFSHDSMEKSALNACNAALSMRENLAVFNKLRKSANQFTIENGVGIACGPAIFGFAGGKARRKEFVLVGDVVKASEELESASKFGKSSKIIINHAVKSVVQENFTLNQLILKDHEVEIWEIEKKC